MSSPETAPGRALVEGLLALARSGRGGPATLDALSVALRADGITRCSASSLRRCRRGSGSPPHGSDAQWDRALRALGGAATSEDTIKHLLRLRARAEHAAPRGGRKRTPAADRGQPLVTTDRQAAAAFIDDALALLLPAEASARGLARRGRLGNDPARAVVNGERLLAPDTFMRLLEHAEADSQAVADLVRRYVDGYAHALAANDRFRPALVRLRTRYQRVERTADDSDHHHIEEMITAAEAGHWRPAASGGEQSAPGPGFFGRTDALGELHTWLAGHADTQARAVTGDPGSGKSAVVARIWLSIIDSPQTNTLWRGGVAAVHARGRTLAEITAILGHQLDGAAIHPDRLIELLAERSLPTLVVVDAVEESREVDELITQLLRPLARRASDVGVRLLIGARRPVVARIGSRWVTLVDLDEDYPDREGLAEFIGSLLTARPESPYVDKPIRTRRVARAVALRADKSFLVGRLVAMALALRSRPATDLEEFPDSVISAMEAYLDELPGDRRSIEELLRPLAYAEGSGLPRELWLRLAGDLSGAPGKYSVMSHDGLVAGPLAALLAINRETDSRGGPDRVTYRLFHAALAESVADIAPRNPEAPVGRAACERVVTRTLRASVPISGDVPDWSAADPYIRAHLAGHAAGTAVFDELVADSRFLLDADVAGVLAALAEGPNGPNRVGVAYELVADRLAEATRPERAAYLALSGLQEGTTQFADELRDTAGGAPWWPVNALWARRFVHRIVNRHADAVNAIAVTIHEGEPLVVSGGDDWQVRIRPLAGRGAGGAATDLGTPVMCLTALSVDGLPAVVAGGEDGHLYILDVPTLELLARSTNMHDAPVTAVVPIQDNDGNVTLLSGDSDGTLRRWTVLPCSPLGVPVQAGPGEITALVWVGRHLLRCGAPNRIAVLDPLDLNEVSVPFAGPPAPAALVVLEVGSQKMVVSGHDDGSLRTFDAITFEPLAEVPEVQSSYLSALTTSGTWVVCGGDTGVMTVLDPRRPDRPRLDVPAHSLPIHALATARLGSRSTVLSGGEDTTVRQWDLGTADADTARADDLRAVGLTVIDGHTVAVQSTERSITLRTLPDWRPIGGPVEADPSATLLTAFAVHGGSGDPLVATGDNRGRVAVHAVHGRQVTPLDGHGDGAWVADVEFAALDGTFGLATIGHDDLLCFHSLERVDASRFGRFAAIPRIALPDVRGNVSQLALTPTDQGLLAAVATSGGQVQVWDARSGRNVTQVELDGIGTISALAARHGVVFGGTLTGRTFSFSIENPEPIVQSTHQTTVAAAAVSRIRDRLVVVSGSESGEIVVRRPDGEPVASFALDAAVHGLLVNEHVRHGAQVATTRGVVTVRILA